MTNNDYRQEYQFNDKVEAQFIGGTHYHGVNPPKIKSPNNVPSPTARYFVGREKDLENLHKLVQNNQTVSISAIQGMGGIGKTELAKYYAIRYQKDYPDGIAWLTFGTVGIAEEIVSFGRNVLKLSFPEDAPIEEKAAQVWQNWQVTTGALVIIDNVNRKEDYDKIKPYLPKGTGFKIVLSSRVRFSNIPAYNLELLELDKAVDLLERLADAEHREWSRELAETLCKDKLGRLPLAITLVGCYLGNDRGLTLENVIKRLNKKGLDAKPLHPADSTVAERGVKAAIELTYEILEAECQDLAIFLSLFACAPIEWRLVESAKPKARFWQFWLRKAKHLKKASLEELEYWQGELLRYSLLDAKTLENTKIVGYQFHPLVWEFLREKVNERLDEQVIRDFVKGIVTEAETIKYNAPLADYEKVRPSIPHIEEVAEVWMDYVTDEDVIAPCSHIAWFYAGLVNYVQSEIWLQKNIELAKKRLPSNHPDIATTLGNLANLCYLLGKYTEAEPLNQEALKIARQSLPSNHPLIAIYSDNLASVYRNQGKYIEAETLCQEALEIKRQSLPFNHPSLATTLNNFANLHYSQGKYTKAESFHQEALKIARQSLPPNHPQLATHLNNLAAWYESQEKYTEAETLYQEALKIDRQSLPPNHPQLANHLNNLAKLYASQGKYTEAEPLYQEALEIDRQSLPSHHPQLATHLNNLASLYESQGKYTEADPLYLKAIEILQETLGEDYPTTQTVISNYERMRLNYD